LLFSDDLALAGETLIQYGVVQIRVTLLQGSGGRTKSLVSC
jgi:hypothetical protein